MRAIAVDDEPIALEVVKAHAAKVPFLELKATFTNPITALDYLQSEDIDLIFLDIKMPDISGIELFNSLRRKPLLIFTTAYSEHAAASFDLDAVDYLLKPFSLSRFLKACNKANELFTLRNAAQTKDHLFVKTGYEQVKIFYDDIIYLEAAGNYVTFVTREKKVLSRSTFSEALNLLPEKKFIRTHRSFIAAINKITKVERHQLTLGNAKIPISEAYSNSIHAALA